MLGKSDKLPEIAKLEKQLQNQTDNRKKLILLDRLASYYVLTNVKEAQNYLAEQLNILTQEQNPDLELNYHLNTAFVENQMYNFPISAFHYRKALEILKDRGDVQQQAETYIDFSGTLINLDRQDEAQEFLRKAEQLLTAFPDKSLQARLICRQGYLNLYFNNYTKAIELFMKADKLLVALDRRRKLSLKDQYFKSLIFSGLGEVYRKNEDRQKCVDAYKRVLKISSTYGLRNRLSWHFLNVGKAFMAMGEHEKAENFFENAIKIKDDVSENARAGAYANLGYCNFQKGANKEALELLKKAEMLYGERKDENLINFSIIESWKARIFATQKKSNKARKHFVKAYEFAEKVNDYRQLSSVCKDIAGFYANLGDYKNAYEYQVWHDIMGERYMEEMNRQTMMELEVKYEAEKKKQEAEMLRLQAATLQLKALRAQMNPHFIYNALNSIQNYITSNEQNSAVTYLAKFAKLMRQSLDNSDLEAITLEEEITFLDNYLYINQKLRFEDNLSYEIKVDKNIEEDIMGVPTMIVQPYVENAIEHGLRRKKNGMVKLFFSLENENTILCIVEDNGVGRSKANELKEQNIYGNQHQSKGTKVTEERLALLHKTQLGEKVYVVTHDLKDSNNKPCGTKVEIKIPIIDLI